MTTRKNLLAISFLIAILTGGVSYPAYQIHEQNVIFHSYMNSVSFNIKQYKCATVREYDNGKTTVQYNLHKKGC